MPRADAVFSLQRAALLVLALVNGDLDALPRALDDRLHQPDRSALTPMFCSIQEHLGELRAFGCTLSGAGPSTLLWIAAEHSEEISARVKALLPDARVLPLAPEPRGVVVSGRSG